MNRKFLRFRKVPFNIDALILDYRDCKNFPLRTGFRYAQAPFNAGFITVGLHERDARIVTTADCCEKYAEICL
jgi:hypothetical protein